MKKYKVIFAYQVSNLTQSQVNKVIDDFMTIIFDYKSINKLCDYTDKYIEIVNKNIYLDVLDYSNQSDAHLLANFLNWSQTVNINKFDIDQIKFNKTCYYSFCVSPEIIAIHFII